MHTNNTRNPATIPNIPFGEVTVPVNNKMKNIIEHTKKQPINEMVAAKRLQ